MFKGLYKISFISLTVSGTLMVLTSPTWFNAWVGLELNMLSFVPLMIEGGGKESNGPEGALSYFLVQVVASMTILLIMMIKNLHLQGMGTLWIEKFFCWSFVSPENGMKLALAMSMGMAPLHFWFPSIVEKLTWNNLGILLTWQKLAPLSMMVSLPFGGWVWTWLIICSAWVGGTGGLNQTVLSKLLVYSSINHMGWLGCALKFSNSCWVSYFLIYSIMTIMIIWVFQRENCYLLTHLWTQNSISNTTKVGLMLSVLSLGGLPPFLGFFPKWNVMNLMIQTGEQILGLFMIMMTLVTLYYYFRMVFVTYMHHSKIHKITNTIGVKTWETSTGGLMMGLNLGGLMLGILWWGV